MLQMLTDQPETSAYDIVKGYWAAQHKGADFEAWWRRAVHDGVVPDTALPAKTPAIRGAAITAPAQKHAPGRQAGSHLPPRPDDLRWPLRQQRLAAGAAQADHQAHLGQRRDHEPRHGPLGSRTSDTGDHAGVDLPGPHAARAGVGPARARRWRGHPAPGLRPHQGRPRRHGHGLQSVRPAHRPRRCGTTSGLDAKKASGTYVFATTQNDHVLDTRAPHHPQGRHRGVPEEPGIGARRRRRLRRAG